MDKNCDVSVKNLGGASGIIALENHAKTTSSQKIAILSILMAFSLICHGCLDDNLSREKAKSLIIEKYRLPESQILSFNVTEETGPAVWAIKKFPREVYQSLERQGSLTAVFKNDGSIYATLTDQGKKYAVGDPFPTHDEYTRSVNVRTAKIIFGEIKGIREEKNNAIVDYTTIKTELTPFGVIAFGYNEEPENKTAHFVKYDDGWRIGW